MTWYYESPEQLNQWNRNKNPDREPHIYDEHLNNDKDGMAKQWISMVFSIKVVGTIGYSNGKKEKKNITFTSHYI